MTYVIWPELPNLVSIQCMGRGAAFATAGVLIICPILVLAGYKQWLGTRTFEPLDMPISLSPGHFKTPDFYINLAGPYHPEISVDYAATYTPGCTSEAWSSLRTHIVAYENDVKIGESDAPSIYGWGVLTADKAGRYAFDIDILSDATCLNASHPRLRVWNACEFPYDDLYQRGLWTVPLIGTAGLGLLVYTALFAGYRPATKGYAITESADARLATGLSPLKFPSARLVSSLPSFGLFCATVLVFLVFAMMIMTAPLTPRGITLAVLKGDPSAIDPDLLKDPIVIRIRSAHDPKLPPKVYVNSASVEWPRLKDAVRNELKRRPKWIVYVDGDSDLAWQQVADAVDAARELQARVFLLTPQTRDLVERNTN